MIRAAVTLCIAILFAPSVAGAFGIALSVGTCPGDSGASSDASFDCAAGQSVRVLGVFRPDRAYADLYALHSELQLVAAVAFESAPFWNFDFLQGCRPDALAFSHVRPALGCDAYVDTWSPPGSGGSRSVFRRGANIERIVVGTWRPTALAVTAEQGLFGFQLVVDGSLSAEAGGSNCGGCPVGSCVIWTEGRLENQSGVFATYYAPSVITLNGGSGSPCLAVPARRRTWGQLKSLYR
jgi:hypothetical protein